MNFYKLLKGCVGRTFYNPIYGYVRLQYVCKDFLLFTTGISHLSLYIETNGKYPGAFKRDDLAIFPSRTNRDWDKWERERKNNPLILE